MPAFSADGSLCTPTAYRRLAFQGKITPGKCPREYSPFFLPLIWADLLTLTTLNITMSASTKPRGLIWKHFQVITKGPTLLQSTVRCNYCTWEHLGHSGKMETHHSKCPVFSERGVAGTSCVKVLTEDFDPAASSLASSLASTEGSSSSSSSDCGLVSPQPKKPKVAGSVSASSTCKRRSTRFSNPPSGDVI